MMVIMLINIELRREGIIKIFFLGQIYKMYYLYFVFCFHSINTYKYMFRLLR